MEDGRSNGNGLMEAHGNGSGEIGEIEMIRGQDGASDLLQLLCQRSSIPRWSVQDIATTPWRRKVLYILDIVQHQRETV